MTVGTVWIEDYFGKVERMTMRDNTYHIYHNIYGVAEAAAEHLKLAGYKAHAVIPNGLYRPDSLPDDPAELPELFARLRADPANAAATKNLTFGTRGVLDRPKENIKTTCNNCITVCSGPMKRRKELRNQLIRSGVVELDDSGQEVVIKSQ